MAYAQSFHGVLDFFDEAALSSALEVVRGVDRDGAGIVAQLSAARRGVHALVLAVDSYQPASVWDSWRVALSALSDLACDGAVVATFVGDGLEVARFEAGARCNLPPPCRARLERGEDPIPVLDGARYVYRLSRGELTRQVEWGLHGQPCALGEAFTLGDDGYGDDRFNDWLGVGWLVRRGSQLLAVRGETSAHFASAELSGRRLALRCAVLVDTHVEPGSVAVLGVPGGELVRLVEVAGHEAVAVPAGRFDGCLRLRVEEHWLGHPTDHHPAPGWLERTFRVEISEQWWAPGVGLVRLRTASAELALVLTPEARAPGER